MAASAEEEYVKTSTGDFVFKKAHVHGSQNLYLKGKVRSATAFHAPTLLRSKSCFYPPLFAPCSLLVPWYMLRWLI